MVRLQLAGVDQFIWLYQRDISRKGYQGVKVAGAKVIGQVAKCVATMSANERQVSAAGVRAARFYRRVSVSVCLPLRRCRHQLG